MTQLISITLIRWTVNCTTFEQLGPGVESIVYLVVSARVQLKGLVWNDNRPCEIVLVERKRFTKRKTLTIKIKTEL